ncbi:hypothetical protein METH_22840 (plasmid) [Leisingera methylohalidivorans DSM 14336]|uniref:Uncharacterized protein n=1 Tax=Leisingera methylohalidivorans DSM 14336 TaxID=999552 RepID=V9W1Y8_9RHOB|nr:hypothetical protein METH_22840 [Leisingera methylohalidivorans DSM 14336]
MIPAQGQEAGNLERGRRFFCARWRCPLGTALARGPFPDDTEAALETIGPQPAPEFGAVPAAARPFP